MPALNFKRQFAALVESGQKRQTIRRRGKIKFAVGDRLYLYTGQRTSQCRKLGEAIVTAVREVVIDDLGVAIEGRRLTGAGVAFLAANDGFDTPAGFFEFFDEQRDGRAFLGRLIHWKLER